MTEQAVWSAVKSIQAIDAEIQSLRDRRREAVEDAEKALLQIAITSGQAPWALARELYDKHRGEIPVKAIAAAVGAPTCAVGRILRGPVEVECRDCGVRWTIKPLSPNPRLCSMCEKKQNRDSERIMSRRSAEAESRSRERLRRIQRGDYWIVSHLDGGPGIILPDTRRPNVSGGLCDCECSGRNDSDIVRVYEGSATRTSDLVLFRCRVCRDEIMYQALYVAPSDEGSGPVSASAYVAARG